MPLTLRILAGPSPTSLTPVSPNTDHSPLPIHSSLFSGRLRIRIRPVTGTTAPPSSPSTTTTYFLHNPTATYSIDLRGRFLRDINGDDLVFGNVFEEKLRLPVGMGLVLRVVKWLDPGLEADLKCEKPWAWSPVIITMNTVRIRNLDTSNGEVRKEEEAEEEDPTIPLQEETGLMDLNGKPMSSSTRRRYFTDREIRHAFTFRKDKEYGFDFYNSLADFNTFSIKVPGWGYTSVLPYWNGQRVMYVMRMRESGETAFVLVFELVEVMDEGGQQ